jgi:hypothetical protein
MQSRGRTDGRTDMVSPFYKMSACLVVIWGLQLIERHFLVKHGSHRARQRRHNPHPVCGTAVPQAQLILIMFHEGLRGRVVVHNSHVPRLETKWRSLFIRTGCIIQKEWTIMEDNARAIRKELIIACLKTLCSIWLGLGETKHVTHSFTSVYSAT